MTHHTAFGFNEDDVKTSLEYASNGNCDESRSLVLHGGNRLVELERHGFRDFGRCLKLLRIRKCRLPPIVRPGGRYIHRVDRRPLRLPSAP